MKNFLAKYEKLSTALIFIYGFIAVLLAIGTACAALDAWSVEGNNALRVLLIVAVPVIYLSLTGIQGIIFYSNKSGKVSPAFAIIASLKAGGAFLYYIWNCVTLVYYNTSTASSNIYVMMLVLTVCAVAVAGAFEMLLLKRIRKSKFEPISVG